MQPALNPNSNNGSEDYVYLSKWAAKNIDVRRGDIISLISPKDPNEKLIKRVVGLQGNERKAFPSKPLCINYLTHMLFTGDIVSTIGYKKPYVKVPSGHCWVEGDHTGRSLDSNSFGPVSLGLMTARAKYIVWPPSRWQALNSEVPKRKLIALGNRKTD